MDKIPRALDVKVFVPTKDFDISLDFYQKLGWTKNWQQEGGLAELELANTRFYLQNYYQKDWANNFMLYIPVEDAKAWYEHVKQILKDGDFGKARVNPPKQEAHALVTYVWDPSGVLLHFGE